MRKLFSYTKEDEDKGEEIVLRLYAVNLLLNVIFYFVVNSLNNIDEILIFNLLTIGSIELFVAKRDTAGFHIFRGVLLFFMTFIAALVICAFLAVSINFIFKEKGQRFIERINIYPPNTTMMRIFEDKKVKKTKPSPYAKYAIDKELVLQLGLLQEKDIKKFVENKSFEMASLPSMYMNLNSKIMYCAIMKDVMREAFSREEVQEDTYYKKRDLEIKTECPIYNEIYEKYLPMYTSAVKSQRIPIFYYFESASSGSEFSEDVGMFPTMEECNHYANLFLEKEISLVGRCKKYE
jgi:hypothetical protein